MHVAFLRTGRAILPEIPAYIDALAADGHSSVVMDEPHDVQSVDADLVFRFGGLLRGLPGVDVPEIHEYHSASTTSFPRARNVLKSLCGCRPAGRVFLNRFVRSQYMFFDSVPFIYRDMGASAAFLTVRRSRAQTFDLVYSGSVRNRSGLLKELENIASRGFHVAVAGTTDEEDRVFIERTPRLVYFGELAQRDVPEFLTLGRCGFNYVPDRYPFNRQTSTKVIEYLVAGLPIVSNRYRWIDEHSHELGYQYIPPDRFLRTGGLSDDGQSNLTLPEDKVRPLLWDRILQASGFVPFVRAMAKSERLG